MRTLRLLSLIVISLVIILLSTILLAQSSSSITDAVSTVAVSQAPLVKQSAAVRSLSQPDPENQAKIHESYGNLPLSFEPNQGQADSRVKFLTRTGAYNMFLTGDEAVLVLRERKAKNKDKNKDKNKNKDKKNNAREDNKFPVETPLAASAAKANSTPTPDRATESILRMKLRNANANARVTGLDELAGTSNYFIGNDPAKWRTNVPTYSKVKYEAIYSGIDLVFYGNQRQLEYDFIVSPGVDPHRIAFDISGAKRIRKDEHGDLVFKTGEGEIRWHKPVAYQEKDGARQLVAVHYAITDKNRVGFELAKYDVGRPLYIDPLIYSTYLGGNSLDEGFGVAVDNAGNGYVAGTTASTNFPTMNPLQPACGGGSTCQYWDAFVTKINPTGSALVYSTYLGGNGYDYGERIAVDSAGNAYITGATGSTDFPTMNPIQAVYGGGENDAFVTKINPTGSALVYSTYLGGGGGLGDWGTGIAVDSAGNAYVAGLTDAADFPTKNPLQATNAGFQDAFVAKLNPSGSALVYSTYLGGSLDDGASDIAVDSVGNAYVTGYTGSTDFPTMNPLQSANGGGQNDAFAAKINPMGSAVVYSTYLGGSGDDQSTGIAVDSAGYAYVTGFTTSADFPIKNPLQPDYGGGGDAFVAKINPTGSTLVYSTYLGGSGGDGASGIAVDSSDNAYVTGYTNSNDFPITPGAFQTVCNNGCGTCVYGGGRFSCLDVFVTRLTTSGSGLVYSTYLGGRGADQGYSIAVVGPGNAYVTGRTTSTNFPTKNPLQATNGGGLPPYDAFVAKIDVRAVPTITLSSSRNPSIYGQAVTFTATLTSTIGPPPDGETVTFKQVATLLGTAALSGGSASFTTSTLRVGTDPIKAVYGGDSNFGGSTSTAVSQVVNKATTTTTLASSLNPSNFEQSVTFTASVAPEFSGKVTGNVSFYDGTTLLKTGAVSGGKAKFTTSSLSSGTHTITATYNGSTNFTGSSASLTQQVN
jgi:hypothetical protein